MHRTVGIEPRDCGQVVWEPYVTTLCAVQEARLSTDHWIRQSGKGTRVNRKKLNTFSMCVLDVFACTDSATCSRSETRERGTSKWFPLIVLRSQDLFLKGCTERRRWSREQWGEKRRGVITMAMVVLKSSLSFSLRLHRAIVLSKSRGFHPFLIND